jgi:hypothetical protein
MITAAGRLIGLTLVTIVVGLVMVGAFIAPEDVGDHSPPHRATS